MDHADGQQYAQSCQLEHISTVFQSLDTVRALHHTVVSLRTALEDAHREIENLKKKISIQTDIDDGKIFHQRDTNEDIIVEDISKPESLRSAVLDGSRVEAIAPVSIPELTPKQTEPVTIIPEEPKDILEVKQVVPLEITDIQDDDSVLNKPKEYFPRKKTRKTSIKGKYDISASPRVLSSRVSVLPDIKITTNPDRKHNKQMASKIDVKIKVSSNIKVDGPATSSSEPTTDSNSGTETAQESEASQSDDEVKKSTPRGENVNVQYTTHENLQVHAKESYKLTTSSTENIHLEEAESNSPSEGDNSVFEEVNAAEPIAGPSGSEILKADSEDNPRLTQSATSENHEEVDDIELIFSADDKDFAQEDLVSIGDYEPWEKAGTSGTPVLVNFTEILSDQESSAGKSNAVVSKMDQDTDVVPGGFFEAVQTQTSSPKQRHSLESSDSFSGGDSYNRCMDKKSGDRDDMKRDDSFDTFFPGSSQQQCNNATAMGRRWTNHNVLIETDISKCGIAEEGVLDMGRRNTCPNPPAYRPIIHREAMAAQMNISGQRHTSSRCPLAVKFSRNSRSHYYPNARSPRPILQDNKKGAGILGPKRSTSVQTEISALPEHWRSESHLSGGQFCGGFYTLPSKFVPPPGLVGYHRYANKMCDKSQEARRVLLSDINFTSMVPELSRSADHLCQEDQDQSNGNNENPTKGYYKGPHLKTPDYSNRGITPSVSMTSPGVSQWTVNENSYGTQTTQTDQYHRGDSFESCKSYSMSSRYSNVLSKSNRSRSVPSVRCNICKQNHGLGLRTSESMHYTPRVTFQDPNQQSIRGSLPDLRGECTCAARRSMLRIQGQYSGSTESLLDEADDFLRNSLNGEDDAHRKSIGSINNGGGNRRFSENDIKRDYSPSKQSLPFLPKSPKCLKLGHLAKVITKTGRVVIGRVRYIGPLASADFAEDENCVGLQLPNKVGDCDGSIDGRKFFECEPQHGIFVPFKKIVMAWTA